MPHITPSRPQSRTSRGRAPVPKVHARDFFAKTRTFDALASSAIADCIRENRLFAKKTHRDVTVDGNGNVRALIKADAANPAASAVVERYAYDGFGRELPLASSSTLQPTTLYAGLNSFRFSTKQLDAETGMSYYGYRFYAADAGRWINRDRIRERGGLNVYGMLGNSAILHVDRNGLNAVKVGDTGEVAANPENNDTFKVENGVISARNPDDFKAASCPCGKREITTEDSRNQLHYRTGEKTYKAITEAKHDPRFRFLFVYADYVTWSRPYEAEFTTVDVVVTKHTCEGDSTEWLSWDTENESMLKESWAENWEEYLGLNVDASVIKSYIDALVKKEADKVTP